MAHDPDFEERQKLFADGWVSSGSDFKKETPDGQFWIGVPSGSRNRKYIVEWTREGVKRKLGNATTVRGALMLIGKAKRQLDAPAPAASKTKRRAGRITADLWGLQEKLNEEILRGQTIVLNGEVYRVGNFVGDNKVELWRE